MDPTIVDLLSLKQLGHVPSYFEYKNKQSIERVEMDESNLTANPYQGEELQTESQEGFVMDKYPKVNPYISFKVTSPLSLFLANIDYVLEVTPFKVYDPTIMPKTDSVFKYAEYGRTGHDSSSVHNYIEWRSYNNIISKYEGYIFKNDNQENITPHLNEKVVSKIPTAVNLIFIDYYDENLIYRALRDAFNDRTPLASKNCVFIAPFVYKDKYDLVNNHIHTLLAISQLFSEFYVIRPITTNIWGQRSLYAIGKNRVDVQKVTSTIEGLHLYTRLHYEHIPESFIKYINEMITIKETRMQELRYAPYWKLIHFLHIKDVSTVSVAALTGGPKNSSLDRRPEVRVTNNSTTLLATSTQNIKNRIVDVTSSDANESLGTNQKGSSSGGRHRKNSSSKLDNIDIIDNAITDNSLSSDQDIEVVEEKMDDLILRPGSPYYKYSLVMRRISDAVLNIGYSSISNINSESVEKITNRFTTINKLTKVMKTSFPQLTNTLIDVLVANVVLSSRIVDSTRTDTILPARWANISTDQLFQDMNLNTEQAHKIVAEISAVIRNYTYSANKKSILEEKIELSNVESLSVSLTCDNGPTYSILREMLDKLHISYKSSNASFDASIYALTARYDLLPFVFFPKDVMNFFKTTFNANLQLFASPLTAELPQYTSYFEDTDSLFGSKGHVFVKDKLSNILSHIKNPTVVVEPVLSDFYLQTVLDLANIHLNMNKNILWIISCPLAQIIENGVLIEHPILTQLKNNIWMKWWASFDSSTYNWRSVRSELVPAPGGESIALFILANHDINFDINSQYKLFQLMTREQSIDEDVSKLLDKIKATHKLNDIEEELLNTYLKVTIPEAIPEAVPSFLTKVLNGNRAMFNKLMDSMLTDSSNNLKMLINVSLNPSYLQKQVDALRIYKAHALFVSKLKNKETNAVKLSFPSYSADTWYKTLSFNPKDYKTEHDRLLGFYKTFREYLIASDETQYESLIKFIL